MSLDIAAKTVTLHDGSKLQYEALVTTLPLDTTLQVREPNPENILHQRQVANGIYLGGVSSKRQPSPGHCTRVHLHFYSLMLVRNCLLSWRGDAVLLQA